MKTTITIILLISALAIFSQNHKQQLLAHLENSKKFQCRIEISGPALANISSSVIYNAGHVFETDDEARHLFRSFYFLKSGKGISAFNSLEEIVSSPLFLASLNKDFVLKTEEDGVAFQSALNLFDGNASNNGFFIQGNDWYFIRRVFFDDVRAYRVTTGKNGKILSISYSDNMKVVIPEETLAAGERLYFDDPGETAISEADIIQMREYLDENLEFKFDAVEIISQELGRVSQAAFFHAEILVTEQYEDHKATSGSSFLAMTVNDQLAVFTRANDALGSTFFLESLHPDFRLHRDEDARIFELALDAVSDFERQYKAHYQQDNKWIFVRSTFFDDKRGFVVSTLTDGSIQRIIYSESLDYEEPEEEPFDESTADWGFRLIDPEETSINISEGVPVYVQIDFNEKPVRQMGAWILTRYQGQMTGIYAGNDIYPPFHDQVPSEILTPGSHTIEYLLMRPGMDEENYLGKTSIDIEVEPFNDEGIEWGFELVQPTKTDFIADSGKEVPVEIRFNQEAARKKGVYLLIQYMDAIVGGEKPEHMESPFKTTIPGSVLTAGKHKIEFLLMPPGPGDAERALAAIGLTIEVK